MKLRARIGSLDLAFEDVGAPDAPALLMVHGFTGHRADFGEVMSALAEDFRVIVPDLRGHGESGRPEDPGEYRFEAIVSDLVGLLDALGIERTHLLGHSMGGMVALRLLLAEPGRIARFIAMNTAPLAPAEISAAGLERAAEIALGAGMGKLQRVAERRGRQHPDPVLARWADSYWFHHRRRYLAMDPRAYQQLGRAMTGQTSLVGRLPEIEAPTLVIVGEHDREFLEGADLFESHVQGARRVTLAGAGHHPHQERRDAWLDAVRTHLR